MARNAVDIIRAKRDNAELSGDDIAWFINGYARGDIADEQMSALAMAIVWRGMTNREVSALTRAMVDSGERVDLSAITRQTVDKHSTGGVGDKITLILTPLLAACGLAVPQLSGRGLGHTGGTLDKLEAIPGWRSRLTHSEFEAQLRDVGAVIAAASDTLAPADRKLYALRDITATVESIPLIASSVMSKKLAEGTAHLVLDVKCGSGAFMKDLATARTLAETLVGIGNDNGVATRALITNMDSPLGVATGTGLEVAEALEVLRGGGPSDVIELTLALAAVALELTGVEADPGHLLASGAALDVWRTMVRAQGGDPEAPLPIAVERETLSAATGGFVAGIDAYAVGVAAWRLGAGRTRKEDRVSPSAGVMVRTRVGAEIAAGEPWCELHADTAAQLADAREVLLDALQVTQAPVRRPPLVLAHVG